MNFLKRLAMHKFKYFICERDLIEIAQGRMHHVTWYARKPKKCSDSFCDFNSFLEVHLSIVNPNKDGKNKGTRKNVGSDRKKRKVASKKLSRLPRNSSIKR